VLACALAILPALTGSAQDPPSPAAQRAVKEIATFYQDEKTLPSFEAAIADLATQDAARRTEAGQFLQALLERLFDDEEHGRAPVVRLPFFGGGAQNAARELRKKIAEALGKTARGDEALAPAAWLIDREGLAESALAGFQVVARTRTPAADALVQKLLATPHPNARLLQQAIEQSVARKLAVAAELKQLATSPRQAVRDAARAAATSLGLGEMPPFVAAEAFTPALTQLLGDIAAMVPESIPAGAKWVGVSSRDPAQEPAAAAPRPLSGWLLKEQDGRSTVLDFFGRTLLALPGPADAPFGIDAENVVPFATLTPRDFADDAKAFAALRADAEKDRERPLSARGGLTGQFEPGFISLPEALVAAWSFQRGRREVAASILFPRLEATADDRWIGWAVRDLLGHSAHHRMLEYFSARDYPAALRLAKHHAQPVFAGYGYQGRAVELAAQLEKRGSDFKEFALPTVPDWEKLKAGMDRPAQIRYLAEHLRLLNCIQQSQPGGVSYGDEQTAGGKPVINPYNQLRRMNLSPAELPALIPFLADENFMPTFSYWRDFHPNRTLHRVNWAVAEIIDSAAHRRLSDLKEYQSLDEKGRAAYLAKLETWCRENASKSPETLILDALQTAKDRRDFLEAGAQAVHGKIGAALPVMTKRMKDFPDAQEETAELCVALPGPALLAAARGWVKQKDDHLRFWGGVALLRDGTAAEKANAVKVLTPILQKDDGSYRYPQAFEALLASGVEPALKLACDALEKEGVRGDLEPMLLRLFLRGREEALQSLLTRLDSTKQTSTASTLRDGKPVEVQYTLADDTAEYVDRWHKAESYRMELPAAERQALREKQKAWLREQFALIKAGQKPAIDPPPPLQARHWVIDAP
jgi:hypothetical protein